MSNKKRRPSKRPSLASERAKEVQAANELVAAAVSCRQEFHHIDSRFQNRFRQWLGSAYGIAYGLYRNGAAWRKFTEADIWKGRRKRPRGGQKHIEKALIWTMRYMLSDGQDDQYNRAFVYARGLQQFFDKGTKPEKIPDLVKKHGGIEALYYETVKKAKRERDQTASDHSFLSGLENDQDTKRENKSDAKHGPARSSIISDSMQRENKLPSFPLDENAHDVLNNLDRLRDAVVTYLQKRAVAIRDNSTLKLVT
jgi:hypothetical protein